MTALDIVKALPIGEEAKAKILKGYDTFSQSQKLAVDKLAWFTYFGLYDERLKDNLGIEYEKVRKGEGKFGDELYKKAVKKTDQEMTVEFKESISKHDLAEARKAMEFIVREIQASKKSSKKKIKF